MEFLTTADPFLRGLWYITLPTSLIFLLQTILTFIGGDASDGLDADFDGDLSHAAGPFQFFTFRNLINFLLGFGWTGIGFYQLIPNKIVLVGLSVVMGLALVGLFFVIIKQIGKLSQDNTMRIDNAIGQIAQVYLVIPARQEGYGKVHVSIQNTLRELNAVTKSATPIPTGASVKVVETLTDGTLVVENH